MQYACALYDYTSSSSNALPMKHGDMIRIYTVQGDWYAALDAKGNRGMVPKTYVRLLQPVVASQQPTTPIVPAGSPSGLKMPPPSTHVVEATGDYPSLWPHALPMKRGQRFTVLVPKPTTDEWYAVVDHDTGKGGVVHMSHVQPLSVTGTDAASVVASASTAASAAPPPKALATPSASTASTETSTTASTTIAQKPAPEPKEYWQRWMERTIITTTANGQGDTERDQCRCVVCGLWNDWSGVSVGQSRPVCSLCRFPLLKGRVFPRPWVAHPRSAEQIAYLLQSIAIGLTPGCSSSTTTPGTVGAAPVLPAELIRLIASWLICTRAGTSDEADGGEEVVIGDVVDAYLSTEEAEAAVYTSMPAGQWVCAVVTGVEGVEARPRPFEGNYPHPLYQYYPWRRAQLQRLTLPRQTFTVPIASHSSSGHRVDGCGTYTLAAFTCNQSVDSLLMRVTSGLTMCCVPAQACTNPLCGSPTQEAVQQHPTPNTQSW